MSKLVSRAAAYRGQAVRAASAQALVAARSAGSLGRKAGRETARINSTTVPTDVLTAADNGADAKILIAAHKRSYPVQDGAVAVANVLIEAGEITGLAFATDYFVYYDDVTLGLTEPVFLATVDNGIAAAASAPGRHFVGVITTPADGAADTTGSGGTPAGWPGNKKIDHIGDPVID